MQQEKKLTAGELRIGNLVCDQWYDSFKTIITVESINDKGINLELEDDGNWSELAQHWIAPEIKFEELRGIPITSEWLERASIQQDIDGFWKLTDDILLGQGSNDKFLAYAYDLVENVIPFGKQIEYVHQLQNIFHWATNIELTFKPIQG